MVKTISPALLGGSELRSAWPVVVGAAVGYGMGPTVILFFTLSTFIAPLSQAFGWTRAQITSVTLLQVVASVVIFPFVGRLADRYGARPVAIASLASSTLCVLAFVAMKGSIWVFYAIWFTVMALGAGTSVNVWMRGVISWFDRQRGLAIGLTMLGSGACGAVAPPLADAAIRAGDWRTGYLMIAVAGAALGLPVALLAFREARSSRPVQRVAEEQDATKTTGEDIAGFTLVHVLRGRRFWQLVIAMSLATGVLTSFIVHLVPMATDAGIDRSTAVGMASLVGVSTIVSRLGVGWLIDHLFAPLVGGFLLLVVACFLGIMAMTPVVSVSTLSSCVIAVGASLGAVANLVSFLTARYFGMRAFSEISAWLLTAGSVAVGLFPPATAMLDERHGSYSLAEMLGSLLMIVAAAALATLGRYPEDD